MFRIKKGTQDVITISDSGDVTFSGYYQESAPRPLQTGELRLTKNSTSKLVTVQAGGGRDTHLEKRLFEIALLPFQGFQFKHQSLGVQAEFHPDGDLYIKGKVTNNALANPAVNGPFVSSQVVYAAPGLNYSGNPALSEYVVFQTPTPGYQTRTIDISDFADLPAFPTWPFNAASVPINGLLRVPQGAGPFPLCLIVHLRTGQSNDSKNLVDELQNFTITLSDGTHSYSLKASSIAPLPYPADLHTGGGIRRSVMQTLRLPLRLFAEQGVDVTNIRQIIFLFDEPIVGTSTYRGSLYFDEIQLSH